jgi:hypothetical protein
MTNPTSNYGWQMPTPTDLVTDLPADFEVFGQAVDTALADLKGGTTGQILSKTTNTDMDFTWITNDVGDITAVTAGTGISGGGTSGAVTVTNSMATAIDAKGDLVPGTGADTFARLVVGANETRLVADSGEATGLKYVADTTNYAIAAKGNLLAGTAADTLQALTVGSNFGFLQADSAQATGLVWNNDAFVSYTPTLNAGGGTFTTASVVGKYQRIGKVCVVKIAVTITTAGTATGAIVAGLPFGSANDGNTYAAGSFRENNVTGLTGVGRVGPNVADVTINKYDDTTFIANGRLVVGTIIYEVA